jgi:hypothetical protein
MKLVVYYFPFINFGVWFWIKTGLLTGQTNQLTEFEIYTKNQSIFLVFDETAVFQAKPVFQSLVVGLWHLF